MRLCGSYHGETGMGHTKSHSLFGHDRSSSIDSLTLAFGDCHCSSYVAPCLAIK